MIFSISGHLLYEDNRDTGYISHKSEFFLNFFMCSKLDLDIFYVKVMLTREMSRTGFFISSHSSLFCVSMNLLHATSPKNKLMYSTVLYEEMANFLHKTMGGGGGG